MSRVLALTGVALRRLSRDPIGLFFTVLFPLILILVTGLTFARAGERLPLGLVTADRGALSAELRAALARSPALELRHFGSEAELRRAVRRGQVPAGLVIPAGYGQALRSGRTARVVLVAGAGRPTPPELRAAVQAAVSEQGALVQAAWLAGEAAGAPFDRAIASAEALAAGQPQVRVRGEAVGGGAELLPRGFTYTAAANVVLFVFITSLTGAGALVENRRLGVTRRMLAAPVTAAAVLLGEAAARFTLALFQGLFIFVVGFVVFGVDWGNPPAALLLILLISLVGTAMGMLFGSFARTPEQAYSIGPPLGVALGMLGGCMWPLVIVPGWVRVAGHATPHAWAMDAFIALTARGASLADVAPELAVIAGFAAALLPLATWQLHRTIVR